MMRELIKSVYALGLGAAVTGKEQVEKVVDELVKKGEISRNESSQLIDELIQKGEKAHTDLESMVQERINRILSDMNVVTTDQLEQLEQRIAALEEEREKES